MTNYQMIIQINDKTRANIEKIQENNKMEKINEKSNPPAMLGRME